LSLIIPLSNPFKMFLDRRLYWRGEGAIELVQTANMYWLWRSSASSTIIAVFRVVEAMA